MLNWDTETAAHKINEALARLMGWTRIGGKGMGMIGVPPGNKRDEVKFLPDIFGSNSIAIEAAESMRSKGWGYRCWTHPGGNYHNYEFAFFSGNKDSVSFGESLSAAIARAMGKALESEAEDDRLHSSRAQRTHSPTAH